jgi:imidazolonepropionase
MLPEVKHQGIATAVDVFCENIAFSREQTRQVFEKAKELGFAIKLHAEQLSDSSGAALAAQMGALSCDHLEYLSMDGAQKMADHGTVAVLLPGAFYYLKETKVPPVDFSGPGHSHGRGNGSQSRIQPGAQHASGTEHGLPSVRIDL